MKFTNGTFDNLFLLGRPASGKSEFIDYMQKIGATERAKGFFIGEMNILDDFPWLWDKFVDDDLWEKVIGKRFHSRPIGNAYMNSDELFDFTIEKFKYHIHRDYLSDPKFYEGGTLIVEFARGGIKPYKPALKRFDEGILAKSSILYVEVSGDESKRRNEARYQEKLKHSVLAHKVPDEVIERFYEDDDWSALTEGRREGMLRINCTDVPFITMNNEPESTDPGVLADRYGRALSKLRELAAD